MEVKRRCPRCGCDLKGRLKCPRCGVVISSVDDSYTQVTPEDMASDGKSGSRLQENPQLSYANKAVLKVIVGILIGFVAIWVLTAVIICVVLFNVFAEIDWSNIEPDDSYYYEYYVNDMDDYPILDEFKGSDYY